MDYFIWDDNKRIKNIEKHGFDFKNAHEIFDDYTFDIEDDTADEYRIRSIGRIQGVTVVVVFSEPEPDIIRIISLRKAVKDEEEIYYRSTME